MKSLNALLAVTGVTLLAACSGVPTDASSADDASVPRFAAGGNAGPSAGGSGHFDIAGDLRTFSFTAVTDLNGVVKGQAQLNNRDLDARLHLEVDCLRVVANRAYVGGVISNSNDPVYPVGLRVFFRAEDNGEGASAAPDRVSRWGLAAPTSPASLCTTLPPGAFPAFNIVERGNIQVRP